MERIGVKAVRVNLEDLRNTPAAMYVVDNKGLVLYFNPAMERLFGYSPEDYLGQPITMLASDPQTSFAEVVKGLDRGNGAWQGELQCRSEDGRRFPVQITAQRFESDEGGHNITMGMVRDMSNYNQLLATLKSRNDRLGTLATLAGNIGHYSDTGSLADIALEVAQQLIPTSSGLVLQTSPTTGNLEIVSALNLPDTLLEELNEAGFDSLLESKVARDQIPLLIPDVSRDDRIRISAPGTLSLAIIPLTGEEGSLGVMSVTTAAPIGLDHADMEFLVALGSQLGTFLENARLHRELERRNIELEEQNQELEELLSVISHDLRSPLATIGGYASLLMKKGDEVSQEDRTQFARTIFRKTKETSQRLTDMISFFRAALPLPSHHHDLVDVRDIIVECLDEVATDEDQERTAIKLPDDLPVLLGNRNQLTHVFANLLSNAFKFMGDQPKPVVLIGYSRTGEGSDTVHEFSVADNGSGIPKDHLKTIFTLFNRGAADHYTPGTGIGLAVVERIIRKNGGTVQVSSEEGKGATFTFTLHWRETEASLS